MATVQRQAPIQAARIVAASRRAPNRRNSAAIKGSIAGAAAAPSRGAAAAATSSASTAASVAWRLRNAAALSFRGCASDGASGGAISKARAGARRLQALNKH